MKLRFAIACVVLFCAVAGFAQTETFNYTPAAEVFGGFSLHRTEFGTEMINAPGFDFSFGYNMAKRLRLLADIGGQYHGTSDFIAGAKVSTSNYQLLFGPELVMRNNTRVTPFVHGMVGWMTRHFNVPTGAQICNGFTCQDQKTTVISDSGLALAVGGGFDYALTPMISLRPIQFDYIRSHMDRNDPNFLVDTSVLPPLNSWQKNYRFGVGVVLRLGEKGSGSKY
jgi:opacity protein-like surface antigen